MLVYGWQLVGNTPTSGDRYLLIRLPAFANGHGGSFSDCVCCIGKTDTRYSLPVPAWARPFTASACYAFSGNSLYRADISAQRFTALRLPVDGTVTDYLGMTSNGVALLVWRHQRRAVSVP